MSHKIGMLVLQDIQVCTEVEGEGIKGEAGKSDSAFWEFSRLETASTCKAIFSFFSG